MICPDCGSNRQIDVHITKHKRIKTERERLRDIGGDVMLRWREIEAKCDCGYTFYLEADECDIVEERSK